MVVDSFDVGRSLLFSSKQILVTIGYQTHPSVRSVVHLHATYSTLLASCEGLLDGLPFDPFTPYYVMQVGEVGVLPYRKPGSALLARDIEQRPQFTGYTVLARG